MGEQNSTASRKEAMMWRRGTGEGLIAAVGVISCAILVAISIFRSEAFRKLIQSNQWALHSETVHADLSAMMAEIAAAESAERGYVLTGDERYIAAYRSAARAVDSLAAQVRQLTGDNPDQQERMNAIARLLAEKRALMWKSIQAHRAQAQAGNGAIQQIEDGTQLKAHIEKNIHEMADEERRLLVQRGSVAEENAGRTARSGMLGTALAVCLLGIEGGFLFWDFRKRARAEVALRHERDLLDILMDNVPDPIYFQDREGRFMRVNRAQAEILGLESAEEALGKTRFDFARSDWARKASEEDREIIRAGVPSIAKVTQIDWPGRSIRWGLSTKVPITGPDGNIVGLVGVTKDVTQMKEWENKLEEVNTQLEKKVEERTEELRALTASLERRVAERTAQLTAANKDLEAFNYSVSHDLRAPLRQIAGFAKIMMEEHGSELHATSQHYLQRIEEGTDRMGKLTDALLALSRVGRAEVSKRPTNLDELAQRVIDDMRSEAGGREVEWRVGPLSDVECDPILIRQVFANLLSNAVKFTRGREKPVIEIGEASDHDEIPIYVRDNGVGFDMKYASKLFGVFQRLHRAEEFDGTGIGLATVRRIVQKHGGRVWAHSEPNLGTTFYFTLGKANERQEASDK